ncbi:MAG: CoA-transferase subunit beta [Deltaproteobacteria bacterium]|nr:CoA-transferase subunit beta [Deltaproteobacteria bacterium]
MTEFSLSELMVVCASRGFKDDTSALIGIGLPYVAGVLAKMTHAPNLTIIMELGVFGSHPVDNAVGIADPRSWYHAKKFGGFLDTMGMILHRGRCDAGLLGTLCIDAYGNINSTTVPVNGKSKHITGSGGANDIASRAQNVMVITRHERRKLEETSYFVTSPGNLQGGDSRREAGLIGNGLTLVITDKAVFEPHPETKRLQLQSIHPGISPEEIVSETGFAVNVVGIPRTAPPTPEQIRLIREVIDPDRLYT